MKQSFCIVTAFFNYDYNIRIKYLEQFLERHGIDVNIVSADYDHRKKEKLMVKKKNLTLLHVPSYKRNLSIKRIWSHFVFSFKAYRYCKEQKPDFLYVITPPNFLFLFFSRFKKEESNIRLVYEFEDLWPETLPVPNKIRICLSPILWSWRIIRDWNLNKADGLVFECNLFNKYICGHSHINSLTETIYLTKETEEYRIEENSNKELSFLYLGSVNNIIDIDLIIEFMLSVNRFRKSKLIIIGGGDNIDDFINKCKYKGVDYKLHGFVYDSTEKLNILSKCDFAFNVMKESVFVGATMKSLEYFHYGIPLINTIGGDTTEMVDKYQCGYNVNRKNIDKITQIISEASDEDIFKMRLSSRRVYEQYFTENSFYSKFDDFFNRLALS